MFIDPVHSKTPTRIQICNYSSILLTHTLVVTAPPHPHPILFHSFKRSIENSALSWALEWSAHLSLQLHVVQGELSVLSHVHWLARFRYLQQKQYGYKRNLLSSRLQYQQRNIQIVGTAKSSPPAENKSNLCPRFSFVISILISKIAKLFSIWFYFFSSNLGCFIINFQIWKLRHFFATIAQLFWILCHISNILSRR